MERADWHTYPGADQALRADARPAPRPARRSPPSCRTSGGASASRTASTACRGSSTSAPPPAGLRMLSVEPLLEDLGALDLAGIGWVIVGGESGPGARPMEPDWVALDPRPVPGRGRPVLLQAVGRRPQGAGRPRARRPDARRGARSAGAGVEQPATSKQQTASRGVPHELLILPDRRSSDASQVSIFRLVSYWLWLCRDLDCPASDRSRSAGASNGA